MHVTLAIPCYGGLMYAQCTRGVVSTFLQLPERGIQVTLETVYNESLVQRARNTLVHKFLKSESDALVFIDADIGFDGANVLGLIDAGKDIVCAAYPKKAYDADEIAKAVREGHPNILDRGTHMAINVGRPKDKPDHVTSTTETYDLTLENGCVPVLDAATGFLFVRREVFYRMADAMPEIMYRSDSPDSRGEPMHAFFDCEIEPETKRYLSEDYTFSRRAQRLGYTIWCHLPSRLEHVGTHVFRGDILKTFKPASKSPPRPELFVARGGNLEDVRLRRVLTASTGLYIDVGANSCGNVTQFLYDRGWRGICIEPDPAAFDALKTVRGEDVCLNVAMSDRSGVGTLFRFSDSHLSTLSAEVATDHPTEYGTPATAHCATMSLSEVCERHVGARQIDLLKIDVEGHELEVLRGADWARWKPRILVIEATVPGTSTPSHERWEPILLAAGYQFAAFDGLNRYYVTSGEDEVAKRLGAPLSVWDNYKDGRPSQFYLDRGRAA